MMKVRICLFFLEKYHIELGSTCFPPFVPLISSWQDCKEAALSLGFAEGKVRTVSYNGGWGTTRPQGCFYAQGRIFHFNRGQGGTALADDSILCIHQNDAEGRFNTITIMID